MKLFDLIGTIKKKSGLDEIFGDGMNVPKSVQDVIRIDAVYSDGIFMTGKDRYSKTFKFTDINYAVSSKEDKESHFLKFSEILNSLENGISSQITIINRKLKHNELKEIALLEKANDNIKEYEDLLSNFGSHSIDTHDLIENAGHAANSLNKAAKSGSSALEDADQVMKKTRDAAGDFSSALSKSLSDGEQLLNKAHSTAAEGLTDLETKAGKINTTVGDALDAVNTVVDLNR